MAVTGKLRILVIANLPPYVLGGAENQVARLVGVWRRLGHEVSVAGHRIPDGEVLLGGCPVTTHHLHTPEQGGRLARAGAYFWAMAKLMFQRRRDFDVIYCRGLGDGAISLCLLKALGFVTLPLVVCPINAKGAGDVAFIKSIPGWPLLRRLINRHCNAINIIAPAIEADVLAFGLYRPTISRIPNGIQCQALPARARVSDPRRLVWVGRLSRQKGLDVLLPALATVAEQGFALSVDLVGEGPELAALQAQCAELGLDDRVNFCGALGAEAVRAKLAGADVFILPSRYEGMSNAALEAMEAGLPVILTRCGGIDQYVTPDQGWLCEPEDVAGLQAVIVALLQTPAEDLLTMGRAARRVVEENFDLEQVARRNLQMLATVAGRESSP